MNASKIKIAALAFTAAFATTGVTLVATGAPAAAQTPIVVEAVPTPSVRVSHADLNLLSAAGLHRLNARVRNAAEKLCLEPNTRQIETIVAGKSCVRIALDRAAPQIAQAIDRQRVTQAGAGSK